MNTKILAIAVASLMATTATASAQTVLRFSDYGPNRGARAEALEWFASELETRSNGDLTIEFYWGGSLLGGRDTLTGVASGVADMGTVVGFFTPRELQAYNLADLPVDNSDMWVGMRAIYDLVQGNQALQDEFANAGVRYVTNFTTGPIQLICNSGMDGIDNISGKKIRASGPYGDALGTLGAEISQMSQADVYQALDSGLIDCNQNYYYAIEAYRQHEVADHILALDWGQNLSFGVVINPMTYDSLSDENRAVLDEVGSDFIDHLAEVMQESDDAAKEAMSQSVTISGLTEADRERLMEASQQTISAWAEQASAAGLDSEQLLAEYGELIDKYSSQLESDGYPWAN